MNDTTNTTNVTAKPVKVHPEASWYTEHFTRPIWVTEAAGPKPSIESLKVAHVFGRPGLQTLAMAMFMRPNGATNSEVLLACGNSQRNKMFAIRPPVGLVPLGFFKTIGHPKRGGLMVYKVELTDKGRKAVEAAKASKPAAKPADKGKGKPATPMAAKPGKRTSKPAKPTVTPTVQAAPTTGSEYLEAAAAAVNAGDRERATEYFEAGAVIDS